MSYDEDEGFGGGYKMSGYYDDDTDEPLDIPDEVSDTDFGLDEEDPDRDG